MGDRAILFNHLAHSGLPFLRSFCINNDFFRALLEHPSLLESYEETILSQNLTIREIVAKIALLIHNLDFPEHLLDTILDSVQELYETPFPPVAEIRQVRLLASPKGSWFRQAMATPPLSLSAFEVTRETFINKIKSLWKDLLTEQAVQALRKCGMDPLTALGGVIVQSYHPALLEGFVLTHEPKTQNPLELQLRAFPAKNPENLQCGILYTLQKDPLTAECRVKRAAHIHLNPCSPTLPTLDKDQIAGLTKQAVIAGDTLPYPLRLDWTLYDKKRIFLTDVNIEPKINNFFPYHPGQFSLFEEEKKEIKSAPENLKWVLAASHPLTPLGMSLDYIMIRTVNQACRNQKDPCALKAVRYINGFRYILSPDKISPSLLSRMKKHLGKKDFRKQASDFLEVYSQKYVETIRILENQNMLNRPLREEKLLVEKMLQVIMKFIADTNEMRSLFLLREERDSPEALQPYFNLIKRLADFSQALKKSGMQEVFVRQDQWEKIISPLFGHPDGETLMEQIRQLQIDYGFMWRAGDPIDLGTAENLDLLVLSVREALAGNFPLPLEKKSLNGSPSLSVFTLDSLLYRMISPFRKIILNIGIKLKNLNYIDEEADIFNFTFEEIFTVLDSQDLSPEYRKTLKQLILERKRFLALWSLLLPPQFLPYHEGTETNSVQFIGKGLISGRIQAPCRIIRSHMDFLKMKKGEIMVAPFLLEQLLPIIQIAGGIILDSASISIPMSHVIKHHQIPTLIGTQFASQRINDGAKILLDTGRATAEVIEPVFFAT